MRLLVACKYLQGELRWQVIVSCIADSQPLHVTAQGLGTVWLVQSFSGIQWTLFMIFDGKMVLLDSFIVLRVTVGLF